MLIKFKAKTMTDNINKIAQQFFFSKDIVGNLTAGRQQVDINWRAGTLVMDEPIFAGGEDKGPDPFTAVVAGLIGCTLTTLRMYIRRKGWNITDIHLVANLIVRESEKSTVVRTLTFGQPVTDEQYQKLLHIARNCPVARLLSGGIVLETVIKGMKNQGDTDPTDSIEP
jgi:putative redox protein